jgi:hypothetical protein
MVVITTRKTYICGHLYICVARRNHNHVLSSFIYVQMTTDICVTCRNHNHVLSSFVLVVITTSNAYICGHLYIDE